MRTKIGIAGGIWQRTLPLILASVALFAADFTEAATCRVRAGSINFGRYVPLQPTPVDVFGRMLIFCWGSPGTYSVTLGPGISGDQLARTLTAGGGQVLNYNVYRDPGRTRIWGDGTPPTFVATGNRPRRGWPTVRFYTMYGRLFSNQSPDPGIYTDDVLATVLF